MKPNRRGWVHTGHTCNQRCLFCSYQDSFTKGDKTLGAIKKELKKLRALGLKDVTMYGGETTLRQDVFKMVRYAKQLCFDDILIVTNGVMTHDMQFCKKLQESGLRTITFSLEGYDAKTHDQVTQVNGSYDKLMKSYKNMQKLGMNIRINVTVSKANYKFLPKMADIILKMNPKVVNYLSYFGYDDAIKHFKEQSPRYSELRPILLTTLKKLDGIIQEINVRYLPYCVIPEYSHLITGYHQKIYQRYEWNNITADIIKHNRLVSIYHIIRGLLCFKNKRRMLRLPFRKLINEAMIEYIVAKSFKHTKKCQKCQYHYICNGFWKTYTQAYGTDEYVPMNGKKINDPLHYKRALFKKWEKLKEFYF